MNQPRKPGRPSKSARNTSDDIFHAGLQRFSAQGYDETSLRQIAEDARVDASLIVYQHGSKLQLWQAIITRQSEELHDQLEQAEAATLAENPATVLRHAMESFFYCATSPPMMTAPTGYCGPSPFPCRIILWRWLARLLTLVCFQKNIVRFE